MPEPLFPHRYQPMTLADLARALQVAENDSLRWRLVAEFLQEYRSETLDRRLPLLSEQPPPTDSQQWDVFLAALAEHLSLKAHKRGPLWCEDRFLDQFWFPDNTPQGRAQAMVFSPASFKRRGIGIPYWDLEMA